MTPSDLDRFWDKVDRSGGPDACWPWTGGTVKGGYGSFWLDGSAVIASRVACELAHGPLGELQSLHSCDNPACCNGRHLFKGTDLDNKKDCIAKGRKAIVHVRVTGEANGQSKLTDAAVQKIREARTSGLSLQQLAQQFGCGKSTVADIVKGRTRTLLV